ncbi:hypothetical protein Nepgr_013158 [Nepenthes gracilis]|uniref:Uncharacterized protein n=1 Tax=Nepenthes gracilis TaxID=150966 RepID=A0AAD3SHK9_NEPGR|nr:hypothetical protein Nepgr_013158 [Nepenthes gracilis]
MTNERVRNVESRPTNNSGSMQHVQSASSGFATIRTGDSHSHCGIVFLAVTLPVFGCCFYCSADEMGVFDVSLIRSHGVSVVSRRWL